MGENQKVALQKTYKKKVVQLHEKTQKPGVDPGFFLQGGASEKTGKNDIRGAPKIDNFFMFLIIF